MIWIFYRIDNKVNGKYYLGIHGTNDINDSYMGSGVLIREAIRKYGRNNFTKTILKTFNTESEAKQYEADQITSEVLKDTNNYNIAIGGGGGSKNSKHYYIPGGKHYIVNENAIEKFLSEHPDAVLGKPRECLQDYVKGRVTIHKGDIVKRVLPEQLQNYIQNGWTEGVTEQLRLNNSESKRGFRVMSKDNKAKHVYLEDIEHFLSEGYTFGPPEWMNRIQGDKHIGLIRITKDGKEKLISQDKLTEYLDNGWNKGCSEEHKQKSSRSLIGKISITKGKQNKLILPEQLEHFLSKGWILGRDNETLSKLSNINKGNASIRRARSREEAATRRLIYQYSSRFKEWWGINIDRFNRKPQYAVKYFLKELGTDKHTFLNEMRELKEI